MLGDVYKYIDHYSRGVHYSPLTYEEVLHVSKREIIKYGKEYDVKFEDFNTTEDEVRHFYDLSIETLEDYGILIKKLEEDFVRMMTFDFLVSFSISMYIMCTEHHYSFWVLLILSPYFTHKFLFPKFNREYVRFFEERFHEKHGMTRNINVENYINEVMFQIYIRNRNVKREYRYITE